MLSAQPTVTHFVPIRCRSTHITPEDGLILLAVPVRLSKSLVCQQMTIEAGFPSMGKSSDGSGGSARPRTSFGMMMVADDEESAVEEEIEAYQQVSTTRDCADSSRLRPISRVRQICSLRTRPYWMIASEFISVLSRKR